MAGSYNNYSKSNKNTKGNNTKYNSKKGYNNINKKVKDCTIGITLSSLALTGAGLSAIEYFQKQEVKNEPILQQVDINNNAVKNDNIELDPIKVEANQLLEDFTDVTTSVERKELYNKYYDEYLEITGEVDRVRLNKVDGDSIIITNTNPHDFFSDVMKIQCCFEDDYDLDKLDIDKGDEVTIRGFCKGSEVMDIEIEKCNIKQINNEIIP